LAGSNGAARTSPASGERQATVDHPSWETLGFYIPAQRRTRKAEFEAMRAAAKELDAMIENWGASEQELMREYKEIRRADRQKAPQVVCVERKLWCSAPTF